MQHICCERNKYVALGAGSDLGEKKSGSRKKFGGENHLSPSRRRAFRREKMQTSGGVQLDARPRPAVGQSN